LLSLEKPEADARRARGVGPYLVNSDPAATILGAAQWAWLEARLKEPAEVRLLCSSIPILQLETGHETWSNFPNERARLLDLIDKTRAQGVVLLVGDTHWTEISKVTPAGGYPLWELCSSGLTENYCPSPATPTRVSDTFNEDNFGMVRIDWSYPDLCSPWRLARPTTTWWCRPICA
jgi:alkaline phosphatase D